MANKPTSKNDTRLFSILIGIVLIPLNNLWLMRAATWGSGYPTTFSLFFNVIFLLFIITVFNLLLQRIFPRSSLNSSELLLIYTMLSVASGICGLDMMQVLVTFVGGVKWMATPENEWQDLFFHHIPYWLVVSDSEVLTGFHEGDSSIYLKSHILPWLTPVLVWSGFITILSLVMLCLTVVVRKQWIQSQNTKIQSQNTEIQSQNTRIQSQNTQIQNQNTRIQSQNTQIQSQNTRIQSQNTRIQSPNTQIQSQHTRAPHHG